MTTMSREEEESVGLKVVEAKVVPMVVAPSQPDESCFTPLPGKGLSSAAGGEGSAVPQEQSRTMERQEVDLRGAAGHHHNGRSFILTDVFTPHECARLIDATPRGLCPCVESAVTIEPDFHQYHLQRDRREPPRWGLAWFICCRLRFDNVTTQ
jgi:hypothetical protein